MTLAQVTKKILISDPFYGYVLMSLNKFFDDDIERAGIRINGIGYQMAVNSDFWNSITDTQQVEVIKHELLHACLFHLHMRDLYDDKNLFNIACDAEVNQYLNIDELNAIEGGCIDILAKFPGIKPKAGVKYYYEFLQQKQQNNAYDPKQPCNGGSGGNGESSRTSDVDRVKNHSEWKTMDTLSTAEKELIKNQVDFILKEAATAMDKSQGSIPNELQEYIKNLLKSRPPVFNWQGYLRRLLGTAEEYFLKNTRKRPSKRFKDAMGTKHRHKAKILVGIDTSGSVSSKELADFFVEIKHIYKAGVQVDIAECDACIHRVYPYKGTFDGTVTGRGGTSFKPVVEYFNQHRKDYTVLVFFTDGYGDLDFTVRGQSIWIITSEGCVQNYPGKTVYIPKENNNGE